MGQKLSKLSDIVSFRESCYFQGTFANFQETFELSRDFQFELSTFNAELSTFNAAFVFLSIASNGQSLDITSLNCVQLDAIAAFSKMYCQMTKVSSQYPQFLTVLHPMIRMHLLRQLTNHITNLSHPLSNCLHPFIAFIQSIYDIHNIKQSHYPVPYFPLYKCRIHRIGVPPFQMAPTCSEIQIQINLSLPSHPIAIIYFGHMFPFGWLFENTIARLIWLNSALLAYTSLSDAHSFHSFQHFFAPRPRSILVLVSFLLPALSFIYCSLVLSLSILLRNPSLPSSPRLLFSLLSPPWLFLAFSFLDPI